MASDQTVLNILGQALWVAKPTKTDLRAKQLAAALGYPAGWRVVRTVEEMEYKEKVALPVIDDDNNNSEETHGTADETTPNETSAEPQRTQESENNSQIKKEEEKAAQVEVEKLHSVEQSTTAADHVVSSIGPQDTADKTASAVGKDSEQAPAPRNESSHHVTLDAPISNGDSPTEEPGRKVKVIADRIYAAKPGTGCDMWYHHAAATRAALAWMEKEALHEDPEQTGPAPTPFDFKGGHMLPRMAKFDVGDKVEVFYEGEWWDAKVLRRNEHKVDGFRYQVYYGSDNSKQSGVAESSIRAKTNDEDPHNTAASAGFDETWQAFSQGGNRWKIIGPDGTVYKSKKAAMQVFSNKTEKPTKESVMEEDPPWRTVGSEYLGKYVRWVTHHKASARRTVAVEQIGQVVGWISDTDVDKAGQPGFISEKTGKPAALYHVVFNDEPTHHPYASVLIEFIDLEEYELKEYILSEEEYRPSKKARIR